MPIKELPLEHRDPLALIIARDELPVSDVKKIARLFKDKDISDNTKGKLLYKSGRELLETWSVFEQNRAERAKPAQPKAAAKIEKSGKETVEPPPLAVIDGKLQQLLASLPMHIPLSHEVLISLEDINTNDKENFLQSIETLIENLGKHLEEWKTVKALASSPKALTSGGTG
jgi:ParB family chromosome partitioning protein